MITKFDIKNFKSLHDISFDLSGVGAKNLALIYGENGAGKSHIISALYMLLRTFRTLKSEDDVQSLNSRGPGFYPELENEEIKYRLSNSSISLKEIVRRSLPIGTEENIFLSIDFVISGTKCSYSITLSKDGRCVSEKLVCQLGKRRGVVFQYEEGELFLSPSSFPDKVYQRELRGMHERYEGIHSFIALLFSQWMRINQEVFENKVSRNLVSVMEYLENISVFSEEGCVAPRFIPSLTSGYRDYASFFGLDKIERLFNSYALKIFKDVKRVYYRTSYVGTRPYYELVFIREISGRTVEVPYSMESKGIRRIMEFFPYIISSLFGGVSFIDGLDENLHDLVSEELIVRIAESVTGQVVLTSHNTTLMQKIDKSSIYILKVDGHGFKRIKCISDYQFRTQKSNNVQIKYLNGDYEGVPLIERINLKALQYDIDNDYQ